MSRKDYRAIAEAVRLARQEHRYTDGSSAGHRVLDDLSERLAVILAASNPRFDRERFMLACGSELRAEA